VLVEGDPALEKLTWEADFARAEAARLAPRTGSGFDVHAFGPGDHVWLGGIRIPHGSASVEFRFTGLTYLYENRVHHQIRLAGLDDEWRPTDLRQVRYPKLPPGSYRFEVRAGMDGQWGAPAVLAFQVLPAWWQTWWFRGLAGLGLLGLGFLAVRLRLRSLRRHNQILEAQVAARTQALAEANKALQALTVTDPLTGLKNRRFLDLTIHDDLAKVNRDYHTLHRGQERRMPLNVDLLFLMADLDHFKRVNDTYGHGAGDLVLQQVRDRLLQAVRETDTVVRWGGEEFLVMARSVDRAQAEIVARRILDLMRAKPFDLGNGETIPMTISLGFALYPFLPDLPPDALSWQEVVQLADRCLYAAKESGRDGWVGLLHGGQDPREAGLFLADPGSILAKGAWDLVCSYPDPAGLQWLRGEPQR
jgi:diguanylate cyclase (GGDEF)-like protein